MMGGQNELRYFTALKRITLYQSPTKLRRDSEKDWGLPYIDALEAAYENIQQEARDAIHSRRRPAPGPLRRPAVSAPAQGGEAKPNDGGTR